MAKPAFADGFLKALIGFFLVHIVIVIARAGYDAGHVLAGREALSDVVSRFDISGVALVSSGLILLLAMRKTPRG